MARTTHDAPGVAAWLREQGATVEDEVYRSTALPDIAVRRWTVHQG